MTEVRWELRAYIDDELVGKVTALGASLEGIEEQEHKLQSIVDEQLEGDYL